jgi:hypothetical protein
MAVRAEIPDPVREPELYNVVMSCMIHGPFCNDLVRPEGKKLKCQQKTPGHCKDKFPFDARPTTEVPADRFPLYRRRCQHTGRVKGHVISDEWVVSYNPWLLLKYRCHINVQIAANLKTFKYCYKYVFKKPDAAAVVIDEIENFLTGAQTALNRSTIIIVQNYIFKAHSDTIAAGRVLSVGEAVWRILGLRLHDEYPPVQRLDLHLPG